MDFCRFSRNMWETCHCSEQGHQGSALVPWQDKILVLVPSSSAYNDTWVLCIICGQLDGFGQQFWWSLNWVAMDSVASISAPIFSWLRISHVSRLSVLWRHLCLGKDPGLESLLGLKAECLPQKRDLRLLMPYNLWLHKHFCFCGLGSSSQREYSWKRGGRRQEVWRVLF